MTTKDKYKKVAYYPGSALEGSGHSYNRSTKAVGKALGLDLVEVKNWNCCGAMEVKNIDPKIQTYLSSRVMSTAANEMDMDVVMAPCTRPTNPDRSRQSTHSTGSRSRSVKRDWPSASRTPCPASRLPTTTAACTRGRATSFPRKTRGRAANRRRSRISSMGFAVLLDPQINILKAAKLSGADVIATECPTCHSGLEMHQIRAEKTLGEKVDIKILYFTQLLGMALGLKARKVGVHENISDSIKFLKEKGLG